MDINELKKLIKHSTAVVVLENSEPSFVIMNYQAYKNMALEETQKEVRIPTHTNNGYTNGFPVRPNPKEGELEILDRINKEILALKDEIENEEKSLFVLD